MELYVIAGMSARNPSKTRMQGNGVFSCTSSVASDAVTNRYGKAGLTTDHSFLPTDIWAHHPASGVVRTSGGEILKLRGSAAIEWNPVR